MSLVWYGAGEFVLVWRHATVLGTVYSGNGVAPGHPAAVAAVQFFFVRAQQRRAVEFPGAPFYMLLVRCYCHCSLLTAVLHHLLDFSSQGVAPADLSRSWW